VNGVKVEKITDCLYSQGWSVFVGLDFSSGDDLFAMSMLGVNYSPGLEMSQRFFADTYLWILEAALQKSPNRQFFEQLIEQKWLRVCPGKVFNPDYAINELMSLNEMGINLAMFGYDPAQSHDPINTIKAWLQSLELTAPIINDMVVPVSQSAMTLNPLVQKIERYTLASSPWLTFSANPLWPWMFGNVVLVYSRDGTLCRPQKSGDHRKIDGVAALLDALAVFDISESKIKQ
jgi:phage terminase large subunit-like protein